MTKITRNQKKLLEQKNEIVDKYKELKKVNTRINCLKILSKEYELATTTIERIMYDKNYPFTKCIKTVPNVKQC